MQWFDFILDVGHPGRKVRISMDMAHAHYRGAVGEYTDIYHEEGHLIVGFIEGSLTSILQVCDITVNNQSKAEIKQMCLKYQTGFIQAEQFKYPDGPNRSIKIKVSVKKMTKSVE